MLGDETYPVNVARTETFGHVLESYRKQLASNAIFHARYRSLVCIDLYEQSDGSPPKVSVTGASAPRDMTDPRTSVSTSRQARYAR